MKKILIIGGAGYIGTKLYQDLERDYYVDSVDLEWFCKPKFNNVNIDYDNLKIKELSCYDVVILLAAHASVKMCKDGQKVFQNDVVKFCQLFEKISIISQSKRIKFIYASTASLYGHAHDNICSELDVSCNISNFYDLSKKFNDEYALQKIKEVEFYGLRFGTVNGYSPHLRIDIMINAMYYNVLNNGKIFCSTQDINRSILDINDLTQSIKCIISHQEDKRGIYNLCSFNSSSSEICHLISKELKCPIEYADMRSPYSFHMDISKIHQSFPEINITGSINSILNSLKEQPFSTSKRE